MRSAGCGWSRRALVAGALGWTAACAPTVRLPAADVRLPTGFETRPASTAGSVIELDTWWRSFSDPQLTALIETALARSTTSRLAYARIIEARAARRQTNASTLPSGSLSATATEQGTRRLWDAGANQSGQTTYQATFYPSWEVDLFGRLAAIREKADLDYRSAALDFQATRLSLAADVAAALFQARLLSVQLANARDTLRISTELAASGRAGLSRGLISGQDAARLDAELASNGAEAVRLEAELRAAKRSLLILVGEPMESTDRLDIAAQLTLPPPLPEATPGLLLSRRPDVLRAAAGLAAATRTVQIDRLALFPKLTIQPGLGLTAASGGGTGLWSIATGLTAPVLDRARLLAALRVSEARGQQAVIGYEAAVQTAFGEAENALTRVDADQRRLGQLLQAAGDARHAFDAARSGYAAGLTDLTTLLQAERTWLQNRAALNAGRYSLLSGTVTAVRALGGGWDALADLSPDTPMPSSPKAQ